MPVMNRPCVLDGALCAVPTGRHAGTSFSRFAQFSRSCAALVRQGQDLLGRAGKATLAVSLQTGGSENMTACGKKHSCRFSGTKDRADTFQMDHGTTRYSRHELLKIIGREGQARIERARVFVAGLGALGSLISMLLARAGVGFLRIADLDAPELHNLHRQILYDEQDVQTGLSKAEIARKRLHAANSGVEIEAFTAAVNGDNVGQLIDGVDLVVDALDNVRTRYIINDAIVAAGIPFVFGGAVETVGNVMTIIPGKTPCLRCLWPDPAAVEGHATASQVGVLSSAASTIASIQVTEAIKVLTRWQGVAPPGLLSVDVWTQVFRRIPVERDPSCMCRGV